MKLRNESLSTLLKKTSLIKYNIIYIEESFSLNKKEFERYIFNYEKHFIVIIEKLRSEMIIFVIYVYREEKRFKNLI